MPRWSSRAYKRDFAFESLATGFQHSFTGAETIKLGYVRGAASRRREYDLLEAEKETAPKKAAKRRRRNP
jgi:hypothetical protein